MLNFILFACITVTVLNSAFITPAYPPTAFQNQFYSIRFRIRGVDFPVYKFHNLPEGLTAKSDGTVSGVPLSAGSFSVKLAYTSMT